MRDRSIDALIVRHMLDLEDANKIADRLDLEIWRTIGDVTQKWAKGRGWDFGCDEDDIRVAPRNWRLRTEETNEFRLARLAYFVLDAGPDDDWGNNAKFDDWGITRLCQLRGLLGFRWKPAHFSEGNKLAWKRFAEKSGEEIERRSGLNYESKTGGFYLQIRTDVEALALAVENDVIDDALTTPVQKTLDALASAEPMLAKLLVDARKQFKK